MGLSKSMQITVSDKIEKKKKTVMENWQRKNLYRRRSGFASEKKVARSRTHIFLSSFLAFQASNWLGIWERGTEEAASTVVNDSTKMEVAVGLPGWCGFGSDGLDWTR